MSPPQRGGRGSVGLGSNVITAKDGETTKTYAVTVTRADSPPPSPAATIDFSLPASVTRVRSSTSPCRSPTLSRMTMPTSPSRADVVGADACATRKCRPAPNVTRRDARTRDAARPGSADPRLGPRSGAVTVAAGRPEPTVRAPGAVARGYSARRTPAAPVAGDAH